MILLCDIGNSVTKLAIGGLDKPEIIESIKTGDIESLKLPSEKFKAFAITSVVPHATEKLINVLKDKSEVLPYLVSHNSRLNISLEYETPETLGIDRICNSVAAVEHFHKNIPSSVNKNTAIVTADFGTATTVNVILSHSRFIGGMILPGIEMLLNTLHSNTAQLPEVKAIELITDVGKSTRQSIASGVANATLGSLLNLEATLKRKYSIEKTYWYLGGGKLGQIKEFINFDYFEIPCLTLRGLELIYRLNNTHAKNIS